jgi:hypothetical protein
MGHYSALLKIATRQGIQQHPTAYKKLSQAWLTAFSLLLAIGFAMPISAQETAQEADSANTVRVALTLTNGTAEASGTTEGSQNFTQMAARDRRRKICLGYGTVEPNYVLTLAEPQPRLRIAVDSSGSDTTLLVQGPQGIDCNDNYRRDRRDAAITDSDWPAGTYNIWVGAFSAGDRINYDLKIGPPDTTEPGP